MRTTHRLLMAWLAFLLLIQGCFGVFIFSLGLSDQQRLRVSQWMMGHKEQMFFIGGLLVLLTILLIAVTIRFDRKEYYQVKMGFFGLATEVDLDVVRSLVGRYWQTHFPSINPQIDALLRSDQTLELFVELPKVALQERTEVMQRIESDLGRQFARHLGYRRPFLITVYS